MATRSGRVRPVRAAPPGVVLGAELEARGWTQCDLAAIMDRPLAAINQIIRGKKRITAETASELGRALGTSPELWLNLEAAYQLEQTQDEQRLQAVEARRELWEAVPCLRDLTKRGWLAPTDDVEALRRSVLEFFGVSSLADLQGAAAAAAFRRSPASEADPVTLLAWLRRAELDAGGQRASRYSHDRLVAGLPQLLSRAEAITDVAVVPDLLRDLGIRLVIVPALPGTRVDGATIHAKRQPIIALSLRYDRVDWFWFTLLHELAHLWFEHPGDQIDETLRPDPDDPREAEANRAAMDWLVPPGDFLRLRTAVMDRVALADIVDFARAIGRHPGIVVGRLHWEGLLPYSHLRRTLVKVSPFLS